MRSLKIPDKAAGPVRLEAQAVPLKGGTRGLGIIFKGRQIIDNTERLQRGKCKNKSAEAAE